MQYSCSVVCRTIVPEQVVAANMYAENVQV